MLSRDVDLMTNVFTEYGRTSLNAIYGRIKHSSVLQRKYPKSLDDHKANYVGKISNTLLVDINYQAPAAAQASSNLVRCAFAASAVSLLQQMIDTTGVGWSFTILSGLSCCSAALFMVEYLYGMNYRQKASSTCMDSTILRRSDMQERA